MFVGDPKKREQGDERYRNYVREETEELERFSVNERRLSRDPQPITF